MVKGGGVQQRPGLPGLLQDRQHDLIPQGRVEAHNLLDVTEHLGGLHLRQQTALLQAQQPVHEQLERVKENKSMGLYILLTNILSQVVVKVGFYFVQ